MEFLRSLPRRLSGSLQGSGSSQKRPTEVAPGGTSGLET